MWTLPLFTCGGQCEYWGGCKIPQAPWRTLHPLEARGTVPGTPPAQPGPPKSFRALQGRTAAAAKASGSQ